MSEQSVLGVILAGGCGRRFEGRDKAFVTLSGQTLIARVIRRLSPQVEALLINANGDAARFDGLGLPVVGDPVDDGGPLAGVLSAMEWARLNRPEAGWILTAAVDTPFFPYGYRKAMMRCVNENGAQMACAASSGRLHPVFALWPVSRAGDLRMALEIESLRKVRVFMNRYECARVNFGSDNELDPFFNINTADDLRQAEKIIVRSL